MPELSRRTLLAAGASTVGLTTAGCLGDSTGEWESGTTIPATSATQYQGPNCNCCDEYARYLQGHLETTLAVEVRDDLAAVKNERGIDGPLQSCHTVELDEYVVEGHIPVDVVGTLLEDRPDITGIALPGMPGGAPGMGGVKDETWTVYVIGSGSKPRTFTEV